MKAADLMEATRIIRSTLTPVVPGEALHPGPVFATAFHTPGDPSDTPYTYARSHNPTWTALERAIGQMESGVTPAGGRCRANALLFGSGMAAVVAVFGAVLRPGDVVVMQPDAYFVARKVVQEYFAKMGALLRLVAMTDAASDEVAEALRGARLLWIETPSNPGMAIADIAALSERAHAAGALVAVDNTTATPLGQKPLVLGADFSVASDTKSMTGHSDLLLGHVATRDRELLQGIEQWRTLTGGIVGPMEAWLALRSLGTLPLRLERSSANALAVAEFLGTRGEVSGVVYPGLPGHPGQAVAVRQMRYFGAVLGFELRDRPAAERFLAAAELVTEATSFGGISTTAERRARWGGDAVPEGFVRMSVGCEAVEDLIADIAQALDAVR